MNKVKSKENINPNAFNHNKNISKDNKQKVQQRPLFNGNPCNPEKLFIEKDQKRNLKLKSLKIKQYPKPESFYEDDIIHYVFEQSASNLMQIQQGLQSKQYKEFTTIRNTFIQAIYKQCQIFELKRKTFYLYVYFLDSYIGVYHKQKTAKKFNSSVALGSSYACFLMAQKYQQIYPPSIQDWLPKWLHESVYKDQGKIIFALNFKFIYESLQSFLEYWSFKYELTEAQRKSCSVTLDSIAFDPELLYRYEPYKISKAVVLMQIRERAKKNENIVKGFDSKSQKNRITEDIRKHIGRNKTRIAWIQQNNF